MSKAFTTEVLQMEVLIGAIALALGVGICAAGGLLAARAGSRREGVDPAVDDMRKPAERQR